VKQELVDADLFPSVGCCRTCVAVVKNAAQPHSDVTAKRGQRDYVLKRIEEALAVIGAFVNVFLLDDVLEGKLLTEEIWARFKDMATGRLRVFAPNLKPDIVELLRKVTDAPADGVVSGVGCVCHFLARWEPLIATTGGFAVVFADVHNRTAAARVPSGPIAAVRRR
jgi:hypothetical protein